MDLDHLLLVLPQELPARVLRVEVGERRQRDSGLRLRRDDRKRAKLLRVVANRVRRANAHGNRAIIETELAGRHAHQRAAHRRLHLVRRETGTIRLGLVELHHHLGARLGDAVVQILDAVDLLELRRDLLRVGLERVEIRAEKTNLHRARRAREIVDHVGENLNELDVQPRYDRRNLAAYFVNDLEDRPTALAPRLETRDDVTRVLLRREQPELRSGASRRAGDLRSTREYSLDDVELSIRLGECGAAGREVIEHKRALVHLRQEPGADEAMREVAGKHEDDRDQDHPSRVVEQASE